MKQVVFFMSRSKGYKTHNKFHNYHMKRKFISDSSNYMLKPQKIELEDEGPCTGHRSIIAILHCFLDMKSTQINVD